MAFEFRVDWNSEDMNPSPSPGFTRQRKCMANIPM
jgi:hypothetical protein